MEAPVPAGLLMTVRIPHAGCQPLDSDGPQSSLTISKDLVQLVAQDQLRRQAEDLRVQASRQRVGSLFRQKHTHWPQPIFHQWI